MVRRRSSPAKTSQKSAQQGQSPVSLITWSAFQSHVRYLSAAEQAHIHTAFLLGQEVHAGGKRKSGEPYFNHCIAVAHMLADMLADAETIIAALLHDSIEDTSLTLSEIEETFGTAVRKVVDGLTKLRAEDVSGRSTLDEKIETLRKIFTLMEEDVRIMVIKLVDRLHNMQTVEYLLPEKQRLLAEETLDVYVKIADQLCMQDLRDELAELCIRVTEPVTFEKLLALRVQNETQGKQIISSIARSLQTSSRSLPVDIQHEHKRWRTLRSQLAAQGSAVTGLTSMTAVFLCDDIPSCYQVLGALHQDWRREALSFQDFINSSMINGYQGVHTTIILEDGTRVRCKIRTRAMQEYARKGVATQCFDQEALGILRYLPWAQRISPLASDTAERSKDFWESLQSDILGDSIVIHSMDDQTVLLPDGATALDGAFYCIGDDALRVKTVKVDGREVPLQSQLVNGVSLAMELHSRPVVTREWLQWVRTGVASATIHTGLSRQPREKKIAAGRVLLEQMMIEKKKGMLAEFEEQSLMSGLRTLGYSSLNETAIAIAEGRLEPMQVLSALFERKKKQSKSPSKKRERFSFSFSVKRNDIETRHRLLDIHQSYDIYLNDIRIRVPSSRIRRFTLLATLSSEECEELKKKIVAAGGMHVECVAVGLRWKQRIAAAAIVVLWGLDPVFAHALLADMTTAIDLTAMRFLIFFLASSAFYVLHRILRPQKLKHLSPLHPSLFLSSVALFVTGLCTYFALSLITPIQYILFIAAGFTLTSLLRAAYNKTAILRPAVVLAVTILTLWTIILLQGVNLPGIFFALASGLGFGFYSEISRRYQEEVEKVNARYPEYLLWLSFIAFLLSLPVVSYTHLFAMPIMHILAQAGFVLAFVCLPYALYYMLTRSVEATTLDRQLLFVCIVAMAGEMILTQTLLPLFATPVLLALLWWEYMSARPSLS